MTPRIVAANLRVRFRMLRRAYSAMFFTIAFPVLLVLVFGAIFTKPEHLNLELTVQDLDGSEQSRQLVDTLAADGVFRTTPAPPDVDAVQYARTHKLNLVLVIPRGYGEMHSLRLATGDPGASAAMTSIYDPSSTSVTTKLQFLDSIVAAANQRMSGSPPFMTLTRQSILDKQYRFIEFFVPGIIAMAVMTSCLSGALNMNAELRQKGILRKLATTPITPSDWLLSNILYQLALAVISTTLIILVAFAVFGVRLRIDGWLPLFIVLEVFAFVGIGMMLTPIARDAESATAAANAFLFPMMFLSGTFFPVEMMPGFLQTVARGIPLYYINEGLRASMIFSDHMDAAWHAMIIAGVAATVFVIGARVTRWERES